MFFGPVVSTETILKWVGAQVDAMRVNAPHGIDIEVRAHKKQRTYQQNALYWSVVDHIVKFCSDTGFRPQLLGVMPRAISRDLLHEMIKLHFSVPSTAKLSTAEFGTFIDSLQLMMVEQSHGEYQPIIPDDLMWAGMEAIEGMK